MEPSFPPARPIDVMGTLQKNSPIDARILIIRGKRVMLSNDLAQLYGVLPKVLMQAVKRNRNRFPGDFMFQLILEETRNLKSQTVTSSWGGARRSLPYAFTEQGVAMLSSVLRSDRAVRMNIEIMRAFARLREVLATHKELSRKLEEVERRLGNHDAQFKVVFDAIRALVAEPEKPKRRIGYV